MMMGDRLYGSVWMPGDAMPDDLVSKIYEPARQARLILNRLVKCG